MVPLAINYDPQSSEPHLGSISEQEDSICICRDPRFYFDEVSFLVEDVLFKLPRYYFEQNSKALRGIFYSSAAGKNVKRFIGDQIIHLEGTSKQDFRLLLKVVFPEPLWGQLEPESGDAKGIDIPVAGELLHWKDWVSVLKVSTQLQLDSIRDTSIRQISCLPIGVKDWADVLRMATEWEVQEIRKTAIRRLEGAAINVLEKIELAIECKVKEWLLQSYQQLVERDVVISPEEEGRLGWKTTSRLFRLRHKYLQERSDYGTRLRHTILISNAFSTDLEALTYTGSSNRSRLKMKAAHFVDKRTLSSVGSLHYPSVIFLVQGTLFKIPWHYLKQNSDVFGDMPPLPAPENRVIDGSRDENPFRLDGIKKDDFIRLLRVIFRAESSMPHQDQTISWKDWISVFKLADMWLIGCLRKEAVIHITHPPKTRDEWTTILKWSTQQRVPEARAIAIQYLASRIHREIQKIQLARECKIADWLVDGYSELVRRDAEISEHEETLLGRATTSKLFRIRDKYLQDKCIIKGSTKGSRSRSEQIVNSVHSDIHAAFKAELEAARFIP